MAAKKKSAARPAKAKSAATPARRTPAKKATKKATRPAAVLETTKKAVSKVVRAAKRKLVDVEHAVEDRIKAAVARKGKKKPARPVG